MAMQRLTNSLLVVALTVLVSAASLALLTAAWTLVTYCLSQPYSLHLTNG